MSDILTTLFNRRAELLEHLKSVDDLILSEGRNYNSSLANGPQTENLEFENRSVYSGEGSLNTTNQSHTSFAQNLSRKLPKGTTMKSAVISTLTTASESGMTVREIKDAINNTYGPDTAKNVDQVLFGLIKTGQGKSVNNPGERKRYLLTARNTENPEASAI